MKILLDMPLPRIPPRVAALCGFLGPMVGLFFLLFSIHLAGGLDVFHEFYSDLGGQPGERPVWSARGTESLLFNLGMFLTGVLASVFMLGLAGIGLFSGEEGQKGVRVFLLAMLSLTLVGVFPQTLEIPHMVVALCFFMLAPLGLYLIYKALEPDPGPVSMPFFRALAWFGVIQAPILFLPEPFGQNAFAETFPILLLGGFSLYFSWLMWTGKLELAEEEGERMAPGDLA